MLNRALRSKRYNFAFKKSEIGVRNICPNIEIEIFRLSLQQTMFSMCIFSTLLNNNGHLRIILKALVQVKTKFCNADMAYCFAIITPM